MTYKTLMVQLELGRSNAAPLGVTRDLAGRMQASVTGLARAQPLLMMMGNEYLSAEIVQDESDTLERDAKATEAEFRTELAHHTGGLDWDLAETRFPLSGRIAEAASTADLLVVGVVQGSGDYSNSTRRVDVDDLILQAGRPVLVVPLGVANFGFRTALVAWKNGREARRALADALPLLRLMEKVVVVEITERGEQGVAQASLSRLVAWLARHGVTALPRLELGTGGDGDRLADLAAEEGAELIVAGAYGHSRFGEWVLGGVTRRLLRHCGLCMFLSN